jgi:RNA polymerase sigma-70 factor (ECF subfamily)
MAVPPPTTIWNRSDWRPVDSHSSSGCSEHGDAAAFDAIVERFRGELYGYIRARLDDSAEAERLTRETLTRFYCSRSRLDAPEVRARLFEIAQRLLHDVARRCQSAERRSWLELCLELDETSLEEEFPLEQLAEGLRELAPSTRDAVELAYQGRFSIGQMASRLRRSEGAIKLLLFQARQSLRRSLRGEDASAKQTMHVEE